jgi:hypothetical protein
MDDSDDDGIDYIGQNDDLPMAPMTPEQRMAIGPLQPPDLSSINDWQFRGTQSFNQLSGMPYLADIMHAMFYSPQNNVIMFCNPQFLNNNNLH